MRTSLLLLFFTAYFWVGYSQQPEQVTIIQEKTKHKIKLYAVNHTQSSKKILVELEADGFRRKSFKPIYKTINAHDTLLLTTLVKRSNTGLKLNYELYYDSRLELYQLQQSKKSTIQKKRT
ncbi:MAG: hypothetical protein ACPG45_02120 [Flavobacteriaceae bacterium]